MDRKAELIEYAKALDFLSDCLAQYHGKKVIILIAEYDVPLENADDATKADIENLIAGGTIEVQVRQTRHCIMSS